MALMSVGANDYFPDTDGIRLDQMKTMMLENPAGATVKIEYNPDTSSTPDATTWEVVVNGSFTAAAQKNIGFAVPVRIRFVVTGYTSAFTIHF